MIHNSIGSGRRILTFPAVHPCEATSLTTLLNSLIDLSNKICGFRSKFSASNGRNARETIQQIRNISLVLEEFRDVDSDVPDSFFLSLSELHLIFQKVRYLLEDCTREGSRLWMLMKSDSVASLFRVLIRGIATGLDVLPLDSVGVSIEVKELVDLIMNQARNGRFEVDPDDKRVMGNVIQILNQFENGIRPDEETLKQVLDYLGIRRWSECNKEIKFLDSEIAIEYSNADKRGEVSLLSGLSGLLTYGRCVLFDYVDCPKLEEKGKAEMLNGVDPDDLRCPITLEYMKDPVTIETGHTYDRNSILKWFRAGNRTCPKTGQRLTSTELVPNLVLKELMQQYCAKNGIPIAESAHKNRDSRRTNVAGSLAAEGAFKLTASFLAERLMDDGDGVERIKTAYEVRLLSKTSIFNRSCLTKAGVIPPLLKLLLSSDAMAQENAISALLNLSKHSESKAVIVDNGGLNLILEVLKDGLKMESRQHAAATLFYIASIEEYRQLIGEIPDAIPALVDLVKEGNDRCKKNAVVALFGLLMHSGNHWRIVAAGATPLLLNLLTSSCREDLVTDSLAVLATLAEKLDGVLAILRCCCQPLNIIVRVLDSSSSRTEKEYCVSLLLSLCLNGGSNVVATLVKIPSLMGSLYSLLTEGTSRASKKANALIGILHEYYENNSSSSMTPSLPREQFIHAW